MGKCQEGEAGRRILLRHHRLLVVGLYEIEKSFKLQSSILAPVDVCSVESEGKAPIYTFNAFFMSMRSKFVAPEASIHYYVVEFPASSLSWADFRGKVLGPTDPTKAPVGKRECLSSDMSEPLSNHCSVYVRQILCEELS